jgi:hypothetical protein
MRWRFWRKEPDKKEQTPARELYDDSKKILSNFVLTVISAVITIPIFIMVYRYIPDIIIPLGKGMRVDHILTILVIFAVIRVAAYFIRYFLYGASIILINVLIVGQFVGGFGFTDLYRQYQDLVYYVGSNPMRIPFLGLTKSSVKNADRIRAAIDYDNQEVRDFAVGASTKYFVDHQYDLRYRHIVKYFSVFKVMSQWDYVKDPHWEEYYAKASESLKLMGGDCDDYSILMAASIKSIGGEVRLVRTVNHLYPEVKVGTYDDFPMVIDLIKNKLFYKESLGNRIYYHLDEWNNIWLNFDYTNVYPGGAFMSEEIIGILEI